MDEFVKLWLRFLVCTRLIYLGSFLWVGHHPCVELSHLRRWVHACECEYIVVSVFFTLSFLR